MKCPLWLKLRPGILIVIQFWPVKHISNFLLQRYIMILTQKICSFTTNSQLKPYSFYWTGQDRSKKGNIIYKKNKLIVIVTFSLYSDSKNNIAIINILLLFILLLLYKYIFLSPKNLYK